MKNLTILFKTKILFLLPVFLMLSFLPVHTQELFTEVPKTKVKLSEKDKSDIDKKTKGEGFKGFSFTKMKDIRTIEKKGVLPVKLPGMSQPALAEVTDVDYKADNHYSWMGRIRGNKYNGEVALFVTPEGYGGMIDMNNVHYMITPFKKDTLLIVERDKSLYTGEDCPKYSSSRNGFNSLQTRNMVPEYCTSFSNCPATVSVLILITPEAQNWLNQNSTGNPFSDAFAFYFETNAWPNQAFSNSAMMNKKIGSFYHNQLFNFQYSPITNGSIAINADLLSLKNNTIAQQLRQQYRADLVIMLTDDHYQGVAGLALGELEKPSFANSYAIVEVSTFYIGRRTFIHEVGHLLSGRHNVDDDDFPGDCGHGWNIGTQNNPAYSIMMSSASSRILHFTNPDVLYNGQPTGKNLGVAPNPEIGVNNALKMSNFMCTAVNYFQDWDANIDGGSDFCEESPLTQTANVLTPVSSYVSGQPPYTYEWRWSTNGFFSPGNLLSSDQSITISPLTSPSFWIQLKVTSNDGSIIIKKKKLYNTYCQVSPPKDTKIEYSEAKNRIEDIEVFPNPSVGTLQIEILSNRISDLYITDTYGKRIKTIFENNQNGHYIHTIDISNLPNGVYFCIAKSDEKQIVKKIIINH
jgi:hypothetical protein